MIEYKTLPDRLMVGHLPLKETILVRVQVRQQIIYTFKYCLTAKSEETNAMATPAMISINVSKNIFSAKYV